MQCRPTAKTNDVFLSGLYEQQARLIRRRRVNQTKIKRLVYLITV